MIDRLRAGEQRSSHRILLVDDHALIRDSLRMILESEPDCVVAAEAPRGQEAIERLEEIPVDLVIMDIAMPGRDGIETTARLVETFAHTPVLMCSTYTSTIYTRLSAAAGAVGYCAKVDGREHLLLGVRAALAGRRYTSPSALPRPAGGPGLNALGHRLTSRQMEVLELIALSQTSKQIAKALELSPKTIDTHRTALMRNLGAHDVTALVRYAIRLGLVSADDDGPPCSFRRPAKRPQPTPQQRGASPDSSPRVNEYGRLAGRNG